MDDYVCKMFLLLSSFICTRFFLYKHHRYKHREPFILPDQVSQNTSFQLIIHAFFYKHHHYKHREPQIWPKIKHHLSTSLSLSSQQHTNFVYANYFNFPIISVFSNTKIHLSYTFGTLSYSSPFTNFQISEVGIRWMNIKSCKVRIACITLWTRKLHPQAAENLVGLWY